ncbi:MAG: hypothetical protein ACAH95_06180 [Fimbriimonas sp.]
MLKLVRFSLLLSFVFLTLIAQAQTRLGSVTIAGKSTVRQIMQRPNAGAKPLRPYYKIEREAFEPDMLHEDPHGILSDRWPLKADTAVNPLSAVGLIKPYFSVSNSWEAANFSEIQAWPPDTCGDVSPTQVLVAVNGIIRVFDKSGNVGALSSNIDSFFSSTRRATAPYTSDPRVRFDPITNRWYVVMIDITGAAGDKANRCMIAVTDGPTITASTVWTFSYFVPSATQFADYPTLGIDAKGMVIGFNMFTVAGAFSDSTLWQMPTSSVISGGTIYSLGGLRVSNTGMYTPQPCDNDDPTATVSYVVGSDQGFYSRLNFRKITYSGATPTLASHIQYTTLATYGPLTVTHKGSTRKIDALDHRLLQARVCKNALTGEFSIWASQTTRSSVAGVGGSTGDRDAVRWYAFTNLSGTPTLSQQGTVFDNAASNPLFYFMGSLAMNYQGHSAVGFNSAGANQYTAINFAQRFSSETGGTMQSPAQLRLSTDAYNDATGLTTQRWGDYSKTVVDPADGMTLWTFQMMGKTATDYGVYVTKLLASPPAAITSLSETARDAGESFSVTVNGTSTNNSGFFDGGSAFPNRLGASFSGSGVAVSNISFVNPTQFTMTVTIDASAASGGRTLQVTNPDGQSVSLADALTVKQPVPSLVTVPANMDSGATVSGTVTLDMPAAPGGTTVTLSSNTAAVTVPATLTIAAGESSGTFDLTTGVVSSPVTATITATRMGVSKEGSVNVAAPHLTGVSVDPGTVAGGSSSTLTVTIDQNAPAGGMTLPLSSDSSNATVPATVSFAEGQSTGTATVSTAVVGSATPVSLSSTWQGTTMSASLTINPPPVSGATANVTTVAGGRSNVFVTFSIASPAPTGGVTLTLVSSNPSVASIPGTVTVAAGASSAKAFITSIGVSSNVLVTFTGSTAGGSKSASITFVPPKVSSVKLSLTRLTGGSSTVGTGTVTLDVHAPAGGSLVRLKAYYWTTFPLITLSTRELTIPQCQTKGTFTFMAPNAVDVDTTSTIEAKLRVSVTADVVVATPVVANLVANPTSIVGGSVTKLILTIKLNGNAPASGLQVSLTSDDPSISVPATVTVPGGTNTLKLQVTHSAVSEERTVTITASRAGTSKWIPITVRPGL